MKNTITFKLLCALCLLFCAKANADVRISFQRSGTDANSVKVILSDETGKIIENATAKLSCSYPLKGTGNAVTEKIICPDANAMDSPKIQVTIDINGLATAYKFNTIGIDIHGLNKSGQYQGINSKTGHEYNILAQVGTSATAMQNFSYLKDIEISYHVGTSGNVHKMWSLQSKDTFTTESNYRISLDITKGTNNAGCFLGISEIVLCEGQVDPNLPDPEFPDTPTDSVVIVPFKTSTAVGQDNACYAMTNAEGKNLMLKADNTLAWAEAGDSEDQAWYFVNAATPYDYILVNLSGHRVYNQTGETNTTWCIKTSPTGNGFSFFPTSTKDDPSTAITVDGISTIFFNNVHNAFARKTHIYNIPCGTKGANYITRLSVTGDIIKAMHYPLSYISEGNLIVPEANAPEREYTLFTKDRAILGTGGTAEINFDLNADPLEGLEGFIYFDWNLDGIFEDCHPITLAKNSSVKVGIPEVKEGTARARIRLTENGMKGGDNEVIGYIFDFMVNMVSAMPESFHFTAVPNDTTRGTVTPEEKSGWQLEPFMVTATPKGNATFVCWREARQVLSLDKTYNVNLTNDMHLVAVFSPNTMNSSTGIEEHLAENNQMINITADNKLIKVISSAKVKKIMVFSPTGRLVAKSDKSSVNLTNAPAGSYIVKVYTETADESAKILLR